MTEQITQNYVKFTTPNITNTVTLRSIFNDRYVTKSVSSSHRRKFGLLDKGGARISNL